MSIVAPSNRELEVQVAGCIVRDRRSPPLRLTAMSSFKRKGTASSATASSSPLPPGTRCNTGLSSVAYVSTGIPSLDDVLGGGIPLGSVISVLTPNLHSSWGPLLQKYFVAQGLVLGQRVAVVGEPSAASELVRGCMWLPPSASSDAPSSSAPASRADEEEDAVESSDAKIKIAWRYEKMQQFQTTVASSSSSSDGFCDAFDLTTRIPESFVSNLSSETFTTIPVSASSSLPDEVFENVLTNIRNLVEISKSTSPRRAVRVSIPDLGSLDWGDISPRALLLFLTRLKALVRSSDVAVFITLPAPLSLERPEFSDADRDLAKNWHEKIAWSSSGCMLLNSFSSDPSLSGLAKTYHGSIRILRSPTSHSFLPAAHKHSILRGLVASSSPGVGEGTGENNLAFRCTRKRFVIETLHLDAEGGVGERRTNPPPPSAASTHDHAQHDHEHAHVHPMSTSQAAVALESGPASSQSANSVSFATPNPTTDAFDAAASPPKKKSAMKKRVVMFREDRPDLYEF